MKYPMTPRGHKKLRDMLKELKAMRPELAQAIDVARQHGDLSENADYDAAKNKSGMIEAKIRDVESRLSGAEIIDPLTIKSCDKVVFGVSVKVEDLDNSEQKVLSIVGSEESDVSRGWISYDSPLAKTLIGKSLSDVAELNVKGAVKTYEILEIFVDYQNDI